MKITRKERLPRYARNDKKYSREGRSDLAFVMKITRKERLPRCARNPQGGFDRIVLSSRGTKRSRLCHEDKQKREIAASLAAIRSPPHTSITSSPIPKRLLSVLCHGREAPLAFLTIKFAADCLVMRIQLPKSNRGSNSNISSQRGVRRHCCCANSPQNGGLSWLQAKMTRCRGRC